MTMIEVTQFENRARLLLKTTGPRSIAHTFQQGDPLVIILPVGKWKMESSGDGQK